MLNSDNIHRLMTVPKLNVEPILGSGILISMRKDGIAGPSCEHDVANGRK